MFTAEERCTVLAFVLFGEIHDLEPEVREDWLPALWVANKEMLDANERVNAAREDGVLPRPLQNVSDT